MRHVIYLLVVMNLVYFSWNMLQHMPHTGGANLVGRMPPNIRHLETIQERVAMKKTSAAAEDARNNHVDPSPVVASPPGNTARQPVTSEISRVEALTALDPPAEVAPPSSCPVLGPFPDDTKMKVVENRLNQLGYKTRERTSGRRVEAGYWVYLPAMERKEVLRITRMLEDNNDRDYLILKGNTLSLGTFDSRARADMRIEMLHEYGLEAVAEPRYVTRTAYWLGLDLLADESAVLEAIRGEYPNIQLHDVACQSIAAGGVFD
jgi:hypothetical protein